MVYCRVSFMNLLLSVCICVCTHPGDSGCRHGCRLHHPLSRRHQARHGVSTLRRSPRVSAASRWPESMIVFHIIDTASLDLSVYLWLCFLLFQGGAYAGGRLWNLLWQQLQSLLREDGVLWAHHRGSRRRCGRRWGVGGIRGAWWKPSGVQAGGHPGEIQIQIKKKGNLVHY